MATRLERSYSLPEGKNISGMAAEVEQYFRKFTGMDVCVDKMNSFSFVITCRTKKVLKNMKGNMKRVTGHDLNIKVGLFQHGKDVKVQFDQEINEGWRTATAILTSFAGIGVAKLHGVQQRHNIPFELNDAITTYLKG